MHNWIILGAFMFVIGFFAVVTFILNHKEAFDIYADDKILNDRYFYCELTMSITENRREHYHLQYNDGDDAKLRYTLTVSGNETVREISVSPEIVTACKELYKKYGVLFWNDLKKREKQAPDAVSATLKFSSSRASSCFSDDLAFPDEGGAIFRDYQGLFQKYLNQSSEGDVTNGTV